MYVPHLILNKLATLGTEARRGQVLDGKAHAPERLWRGDKQNERARAYDGGLGQRRPIQSDLAVHRRHVKAEIT